MHEMLIEINIREFNFRGWPPPQNILTAKMSQTTVFPSDDGY